MTTATEPRTRSRTPVAVAGGATGLLCTLIGTYVDTPWRNRSDRSGTSTPATPTSVNSAFDRLRRCRGRGGLRRGRAEWRTSSA